MMNYSNNQTIEMETTNNSSDKEQKKNLELLRKNMGLEKASSQALTQTSFPMVTIYEIAKERCDNKQLMSILTFNERAVVQSIARPPLKDLQALELVDNMKKFLRLIIFSAGYKNKEDERDAELRATELAKELQRYFGTLTFREIKLAFDWLAVGILNDYLPKDSKGNIDNKHYQNLSLEYFSRILNAYKSIRKEILWEIREKEEAMKREMQEIENERKRKEFKAKMINRLDAMFEAYCEGAEIRFSYSERIILFQWFNRLGLVEKAFENQRDKIKSIKEFEFNTENCILEVFSSLKTLNMSIHEILG